MTIDYRAISDPQLITLLSSPIRQELVDTLAALGGEASAAELALELGRHADGLYYHLKLLCKGKLVTELDGDGDERRYRLAGDPSQPLRLAYNTDSERHITALRKFAHGLMQVAEKDFGEALDAEDTITEGSSRQLWAARNKAWLSEAELKEANQLLERLCDLMSHPRTAGRNHLLSCTFVLAPHTAQSKRRSEP
ncbi:ArsR family transcriptional regulator [Duganella sp. FT50W]|uniref:ArsR family transcriptional regulator n=1 Tax=Duganella lactea TaxID=2692173 RepID=A0A6L8MTA4_9BURK|nr:helix-turn-helix domain-containing protein [Duganella lactea]MYM34207.1 ArsR family transcriptional regulator [Duganella lactea]MYM85270.1 ArsR family transcriptional regulator [Duganella lactea]